jgi:hypothetical protein
MMLAGLLALAGCKKDDPTPVEMRDLTISPDNTEITVTFNQAVYANSDKTGSLDANCFQLAIYSTSQIEAQYIVDHLAGDSYVKIEMSYQDTLTGTEKIKVTALANKIFGEEGNVLDKDISMEVRVNTP